MVLARVLMIIGKLHIKMKIGTLLTWNYWSKKPIGIMTLIAYLAAKAFI